LSIANKAEGRRQRAEGKEGLSETGCLKSGFGITGNNRLEYIVLNLISRLTIFIGTTAYIMST